EAGVPQVGAVRAGADQALGVEVAGEVGLPVLVPDRLEVALEDGPRRPLLGPGTPSIFGAGRPGAPPWGAASEAPAAPASSRPPNSHPGSHPERQVRRARSIDS